MRRIDDSLSVSPQIGPADVTEIARAGFTTIINNRPDGEETDQPEGDAIRTAAETLGLDYAEIPVTSAGFSHAQVNAMRAALDGAKGPVFAYCRSGTRSTNLWALAEAKAGGDPDTIVAKARAAGYDLTAIRPMLDALAGAR
ncbi:TIGR01244 family sulfur transferase [Stakelama saccharophila]|uniref:TIGR01244 family sulfur transferase n=1 Tax=Stakelama saccharophila TaxID=3075605 RepID=A0ABZ0B998_9SPHN|nr:TIGR01244 family sulfur transferase [Stakelama sp. W311]WNO53832.1 TIGR01244 family sulfur transferase [Stakelama sp. W311]